MLRPDLSFETNLWQKGFRFVAGIDEVGRGAWAGPLVVAAVILPQNFQIPAGLADSKLLKHSQRTRQAEIIMNEAVTTSVVEISPKRIDKIKMAKAAHEAFRKAIKKLAIKPEFCLVDGFYIKHFSRKHQMAIVNGDKICASIAAASIIAKVYRDDLMRKLHFTYPAYGFGKHKGYGTKLHQAAITKFGFSKTHRTSYNFTKIT